MQRGRFDPPAGAGGYAVLGAFDALRRRAGRALDALGLGPQQTASRVVLELDAARLREYPPLHSARRRSSAGHGAVLILPAPFKQAYIWDLLPAVSAVQRLREADLRVYLLEWIVPSPQQDDLGLDHYARSMPAAAVAAIAERTGRDRVILAGHSLGGTLAAIHAALQPQRIAGLALIDAPVVFSERGRLERAVRAGPPARLIRRLAGSPVAGTALNLLSVAAAPDVFVLQRWVDLAGSAGDPGALAVHARVDRWTLDEFPLPGRLFEDIVEQLYREDRFRNGTLDVGGDTAGAAQLDVPVLAVVNPAGRIVAPESMLDLETLRPGLLSRVLHCEREWGPGLQHVAPLVGPIAHRQLWPQIAAWMQALR